MSWQRINAKYANSLPIPPFPHVFDSIAQMNEYISQHKDELVDGELLFCLGEVQSANAKQAFDEYGLTTIIDIFTEAMEEADKLFDSVDGLYQELQAFDWHKLYTNAQYTGAYIHGGQYLYALGSFVQCLSQVIHQDFFPTLIKTLDDFKDAAGFAQESADKITTEIQHVIDYVGARSPAELAAEIIFGINTKENAEFKSVWWWSAKLKKALKFEQDPADFQAIKNMVESRIKHFAEDDEVDLEHKRIRANNELTDGEIGLPNGATLTLPPIQSTDVVVCQDEPQTISNKTLVNPVISIPLMTSSAAVHNGIRLMALSQSIITFPSSSGIVALTSDLTRYATLSGNEQLTNKTLVHPTIKEGDTSTTFQTKSGTVALTSDVDDVKHSVLENAGKIADLGKSLTGLADDVVNISRGLDSIANGVAAGASIVTTAVLNALVHPIVEAAVASEVGSINRKVNNLEDDLEDLEDRFVGHENWIGNELNNYSKPAKTETLTNKTIVNPIIKQINDTTNATITFPYLSGVVALQSQIPKLPDLTPYATKSGTETLSNKTLDDPTIVVQSPSIDDDMNVSIISNTITFPAQSGEVALKSDLPDLTPYATIDGTEILTNKTLIYPIIKVVTIDDEDTIEFPRKTGIVALTSDLPDMESELMPYVKSSTLSSTLQSYVQTTDLTNELNRYCTINGIETILNKTIVNPQIQTIERIFHEPIDGDDEEGESEVSVEEHKYTITFPLKSGEVVVQSDLEGYVPINQFNELVTKFNRLLMHLNITEADLE